MIRCTLVTSDEGHRIPHAHRLVRREGSTDHDDPHHVKVSPETGFVASYVASYKPLITCILFVSILYSICL